MLAFDSPTGNALGTNCMENWWKPMVKFQEKWALTQFGGSSIYEREKTFNYIEIADFDYVLVWQENTALDCILNIITKEYPNPATMLPTPCVYQCHVFQANGNLFGKWPGWGCSTDGLEIFQCLTFLMFRPWDSNFGRPLLQWRWLLMIETLRLFKFRWFWCSVSPHSPSAIPPSQFWTCFFSRESMT